MKFVAPYDCCGCTNVISEFILIFNGSKCSMSTKCATAFADGEYSDASCIDAGNGLPNISQWYEELNKAHVDAFSVVGVGQYDLGVGVSQTGILEGHKRKKRKPLRSKGIEREVYYVFCRAQFCALLSYDQPYLVSFVVTQRKIRLPFDMVALVYLLKNVIALTAP